MLACADPESLNKMKVNEPEKELLAQKIKWKDAVEKKDYLMGSVVSSHKCV